MSRTLLPLLILLAAPPAHASPSVELFSPSGLVKKVRQVRVRFSEPMVPFGDPRGLLDPFAIDCAAKGAARWADPKNWVFDFEADLPAGLRCEFRLRSGVRALSGAELSGQDRFSFYTGGPAILRSRPYESQWSRVSEDQIFMLWLDAEPSEPSVLANAHFAVEGLAERVGARIVSGAERAAVLKAQRMDEPEDEARGPLLLLQARQRFPADAKLSLVWGKGVATESGVATEQDQALAFRVREPFAAKFSCERVNAESGCIPFLPLTVQFTAPLPWSQAAKTLVRREGGRSEKPEKPSSDEGGEDPAVESVSFNGPFPAETELVVELPADLADDAGRPLSNAASFPLKVRTGEFPPLAKFSAQFGILELRSGPVLPLTLRNLEPELKSRLLSLSAKRGGSGEWLERISGKAFRAPATPADILYWLKTVATADREKSVFAAPARPAAPEEFVIRKPNGPKAFEVVGIPLSEPGLHVVELESGVLGTALLDKPAPLFVPTAALVTNLSVHLKSGRESSLAWVTTLDKGEPAGGAELTLSDCQGNALWQGRADANGIVRLGKLPDPDSLPECKLGEWTRTAKLILVARLGDDMSFVLDEWTDGIEPWRFELPSGYSWGDPALPRRTVLDRSLFRAGETVHMKHVLRRSSMAGFAFPEYAQLPPKLWIRHQGSEQKYELPLAWDASGSAESAWEIPKDAKLGTYELFLPEPGWNREWTKDSFNSGSFRVEEFRVPLLRGTLSGPAKALVAPASVPLDFSISYLSGGGAANLPVKLRSQLRRRGEAQFEAFEGFRFANGPAPEGVSARASEERPPELRTEELVLDAGGSGRAAVAGSTAAAVPLELSAELEFRDPNGETMTVSAKLPVWPAARLVGLKPDAWAVAKDALKFSAAVADTSGKPVAGVPVSVELLERKTYSHRKRLVGGFYAYEHAEKIVRVGPACSGVTDAKGLVFCAAQSPVSGNLILQASADGGGGRTTVAHRDIWVAGKDEWWFDVGDNDRMDLIPERRRYEPGETAVFQVRAPFRAATALVTIEREGVLDGWVRKLSGKEPVVRVPVKGHYAPNAFVSVLAVRGRVGGVKPTALVDLGRPAYKLGIAEIAVGFKAHELKVSVSPEREVYKVREKARAKIAVKTALGGKPAAGGELAVAVVDEGLLELMPNESWRLLDGMMSRRGIEVRTATAQMHVVGKRHFGLKALPQGGGGGRYTTRELFDTLVLWKGRVPLDGNGEAAVDIPLNDSLTGFRVAAVATAGPGLFGSGFGTIRTTQDLMLLSGLPPLVREGDRFLAGFTARNATERDMEVELSGSAGGQPLAARTVSLPAGQARQVAWDIAAPAGVGALSYEVSAREKGGAADRIKVAQRVVPAVPVRIFQATLAQVDKSLRLPVARPADAAPGRGGVTVALAPSLAGDFSGLVDYMGRYPYTCMEQKVSRAVALRDAELWRRVTAELPSHLDSDGLVKYFPTMESGDPALTAYLVSIANEADWPLPGPAAGRMAEGLSAFVTGRISRHGALPTADLALRKLSAVAALARAGKADAGLLQSVAIEPNLWPTSGVLDWLGILERVEDIPDRDARREEAGQILRSRLDFQGTMMGFSTETQDALWWLMVSNDLNAVRVVLAALGSPEWKEDLPRLLRGALNRQQRGHWDLTVANAWGRLALEKFALAFESMPVAGQSRARLAGEARSLDWAASAKGDALAFGWPAGKEELSVEHEGDGAPWAVVQSRAAIPLKAPLSSGYRIKKTWTAVERKRPDAWSQGDTVRVRLELSAQADKTWVVVDDPIPAGASILGGGLGRDSQLLDAGRRAGGWTWPAYQERSFEAFRSYYEFVPKGDWSVEYTLRLNNPGSFSLPPTRVEAMYAPESFGELPNDPVEVR